MGHTWNILKPRILVQNMRSVHPSSTPAACLWAVAVGAALQGPLQGALQVHPAGGRPSHHRVGPGISLGYHSDTVGIWLPLRPAARALLEFFIGFILCRVSLGFIWDFFTVRVFRVLCDSCLCRVYVGFMSKWAKTLLEDVRFTAEGSQRRL